MKLKNTFFVVVLLAGFSVTTFAKEPDWTTYAMLLKQSVKQGHRQGVDLMVVDYLGIKNQSPYQEVLEQIENFDTSQLTSQTERLAFYINAYNILAIKMVLDHWPLKSIKDAGGLFSSVWNKDVGKINHKLVTLNEVEHEILRKMGEPRIHMAIVCASISCPDLRTEPYTSKRLSQQLDDQTMRFLANTGKGLRIKGRVAEVSMIYDWFEEDFDKVGGVTKFIRRYRKDLPGYIKVDADIPYNWNLNN